MENKRKILYSTMTVVLFFMVMTVGAMYGNGYIGAGVGKPDPNAKTGYIRDLDDDMKESMAQEVEEGELYVSMNTTPVFQDGKSEGNLRIQNPESNRYYIKVKFILVGDQNRVIYESGILKPGEYIENARLDVNLKAGSYKAAAVFIGVDPGSYEELGQVQMDIDLQILE